MNLTTKPHTKTPREISQAASLFATSRYPSRIVQSLDAQMVLNCTCEWLEVFVCDSEKHLYTRETFVSGLTLAASLEEKPLNEENHSNGRSMFWH